MQNILTVDVEAWYEVLELSDRKRNHLKSTYGDRVRQALDPLLDLLDQADTTATFFVVGTFAKKHPEQIRRIAEEGHEIGLHGWQHRCQTHLSRDEFRRCLRKGNEVLEHLSGKQPRSFRAPGWSLNYQFRERIRDLSRAGFRTDSSLTPAAFSSRFPDVFPRTSLRLNESHADVHEIAPTPLTELLPYIPLGSGWSLRFLPLTVLRWAIRACNGNGHPVMLMLHSWAIDAKQPRVHLPFPVDIGHYHRLNSLPSKLRALLDQFSFTSLRDGCTNQTGSYEKTDSSPSI